MGGSWPAEYRNRIFMNNIHGNRLNMDVVSPKGSGYVGNFAPDFLLTRDQWSQMLSMTYGPDGALWLGNDGGVWKSTNHGTSWSPRNDGLNITQFYDIAIRPGDSLAVFGGDKVEQFTFTDAERVRQVLIADEVARYAVRLADNSRPGIPATLVRYVSCAERSQVRSTRRRLVAKATGTIGTPDRRATLTTPLLATIAKVKDGKTLQAAIAQLHNHGVAAFFGLGVLPDGGPLEPLVPRAVPVGPAVAVRQLALGARDRD